MYHPNNVLQYLRHVAHEGEMLDKAKRILKVDLQHFKNSSFARFLIEWKHFHECEAS